MFYRGSIVFRIILAFLILGMLFAGGYALYRYGFSEGYAQATVIAAGEGQNPVPGVPGYPAWGYGMAPFRFGFFPFFPFGFCLFGFGFFFLFWFLLKPRWWGYPGGGYHHHHGEPQAWGPPPWAREQPGARPGGSPAGEPAGEENPQS